jgi:hypothetical protein
MVPLLLPESLLPVRIVGHQFPVSPDRVFDASRCQKLGKTDLLI